MITDCPSIAAVIVFAGGLIGLGVSETPVQAQNSEKYGGSVSYAENEPTTTLNPYQRSEDRGVSDRLYTLIYDGLVSYDYVSSEVIPALAEDWSPRGDVATRKITFELRDGVKWHDGLSLIPKDIEFTYRYAMKAGSDDETRKEFRNISSVDTDIEKNEVTFRFEKDVVNPAKRVFANRWIIPSHRFDEEFLPKEPKLRNDPVGTGPYAYEDKDLNGNIELKTFSEYWGGTEPEGRPYIDETQMKVFQDPTTVVPQTMGGNVDLIVETPHSQIGRLEDVPRVRLESYRSLSFDGFAYNTEHPVLKNADVRRALTHAVDREKMLSSWYAGKGGVIGGPVVPGSAYYNPEVEPLSYDPDRARKLLKQEGFEDRDGDGVREVPDGNAELRFRLVTLIGEAASSTTKQDVAESYSDYLRDVGIRVEVDNKVKSEYLKAIFDTRNFDIAWIRWEFDPNYAFHTLFETGHEDNIVNYKNTKVDTLISRLRRAEDAQRRRGLAESAQKIISREVPYTFLYTVKNYASLNRKIVAPKIDPYYFFSYYDNWYVNPSLR